MQRGGWEAVSQDDHAGNDTSGGAGSDDRTNVMRSGQLAADTNANLLRALRMSEATNETGYATLQQLGRQKETIGRTLASVDGTREDLSGARRVIRDIRIGVYKEWAVKALVLLLLLVMDIILFYMKFVRK
ncbi:hypothetical protein C3747_15g787c [Trypanosoma cruzi]|uniref:Uncharacterized protein n=2 Tax=Trypanosoma cruzi TaxID=5693 RepID=Q4E3T0_TRYCC|nr:hypothetical protein, conserved [Trypanosoma cruzi]EAN99416.1 hypothetical protein, conserved [Trypanosoma cruzi]KAF8294720.1 hypothetical protein TcYC6_0100200 [Trypanosoma cruzi]PWV18033.1 hypothetical protein C3747_15g787c [Trypanosoma cruzi]RNC50750.1 putative Qa-SNARE protein [Trypanosoma cruzi]|eukprot:XP_821267.1 hypothetical protein [Trypanosoma cruzi strain CL Brener]